MDDLVLPPVYTPPSELADRNVLAVEHRDDPLECGFLLAGGVLAPLPPKLRLPHEDDDVEPV